MSGPAGGNFSMWDSDSFGNPTFYFSTADGISDLDVYHPPVAGSHGHFNWGFTQPGTYELTFQFEGTHNTDGFKTASGTFEFQVSTVPEPAQTGLFAALGLLALAASSLSKAICRQMRHRENR
jgi:surface-anchored protein